MCHFNSLFKGRYDDLRHEWTKVKLKPYVIQQSSPMWQLNYEFYSLIYTKLITISASLYDNIHFVNLQYNIVYLYRISYQVNPNWKLVKGPVSSNRSNFRDKDLFHPDWTII